MSIPFPTHTVAWQHLVVLLCALDDVSGDPTRGNVINLIRERGWLNYRPEDLRPYQSQQEPSWMTDIAWSRKAGVISGLVRYDDWNCWEISRQGRMAIQELRSEGGIEKYSINVRHCFLWNTRFKMLFDPDYNESPLDTPAPPKGERAPLPDIQLFEKYVDSLREICPDLSYEKLAAGISVQIGFAVAPNKISIATAMASSTLKENFQR